MKKNMKKILTVVVAVVVLVALIAYSCNVYIHAFAHTCPICGAEFNFSHLVYSKEGGTTYRYICSENPFHMFDLMIMIR